MKKWINGNRQQIQQCYFVFILKRRHQNDGVFYSSALDETDKQIVEIKGGIGHQKERQKRQKGEIKIYVRVVAVGFIGRDCKHLFSIRGNRLKKR